MRTRDAESTFARLGMTTLVAGEFDSVLPGEDVDREEARIVTSGGVLRTGVAQSDDKPGTSRNSTTPRPGCP